MILEDLISAKNSALATAAYYSKFHFQRNPQFKARVNQSDGRIDIAIVTDENSLYDSNFFSNYADKFVRDFAGQLSAIKAPDVAKIGIEIAQETAQHNVIKPVCFYEYSTKLDANRRLQIIDRTPQSSTAQFLDEHYIRLKSLPSNSLHFLIQRLA